MKHKNMCYDNHYKYKLNMLELGIIMMKIIGALFVFGIVFWVAKWHWLSVIFLFLFGIIFAALLILVAIEAHQDNVLNDMILLCEKIMNWRKNMKSDRNYVYTERAHFMCPNMYFGIMAKIEIKYITKSVPLLLDKKEKHDTKNFWELRGIDLAVNAGEAVGVIGDNGSGKAALMKILGQKDRQTTGFITTKAKRSYASCTSLDPEKTGLENIRQAIAQADIDEFKGNHYTNGIINFSEVGELLYRPVKEYSTGMLVRRFLPYFQPYRRTLCADLCCAALTTMCEIVLPLIIRQITNTALEDVALLTTRMVLGLALLYFVLRIIDALANYYMADMGHVMGARIETDMRRDAYAHLQLLSNTYFNNTKVGQIMGRITNDLFEVTEFSHHCPEEFFIAGIKIAISFVILARINVLLTVIIFIIMPVMIGVCM